MSSYFCENLFLKVLRSKQLKQKTPKKTAPIQQQRKTTVDCFEEKYKNETA